MDEAALEEKYLRETFWEDSDDDSDDEDTPPPPLLQPQRQQRKRRAVIDSDDESNEDKKPTIPLAPTTPNKEKQLSTQNFSHCYTVQEA